MDKPPINPLINAIKREGESFSERIDWYQKMIDRSSQTILNCQDTISHFQISLEAAHLARDVLRKEYRKLIENGEMKENSDSKE